MPIEIDAIIAQMEWAAARGLSEFAVNSSGARIHIRRTGTSMTNAVVTSAQNNMSSAIIANDVAQTVDAPMAGICHLAGDSDGAPFVAVGDAIEVGETICMIEAMKVMTSVTATMAGTVKSILIEDGASVDAGTALVEVAP